jgi:hypothetical protein
VIIDINSSEETKKEITPITIAMTMIIIKSGFSFNEGIIYPTV